MTHDDAFLKAIIESPDDDGVRLIYADWLDENGRPDRAAFIRVQTALAALPDDDPRRPELEARERQLLEESGEEWARPLGPWVTGWTFRRGFVEEVVLLAETFLRQAETLFRVAPLRRVAVGEAAGLTAQLAACPYLGRLDGMDLETSQIGDQGLRELLSAPRLDGLRQLGLAYTGISTSGLRELLDATPRLPRLQDLDLGGNHLGDGDLPLLVASPLASQLRRLYLYWLPDEAAVGRAFTAAPSLGGLTHLDLSFSRVGDDACEALAAAAHLNRLTVLDLTKSEIGDRGLRALAWSPNLAAITDLGRRCCRRRPIRAASAPRSCPRRSCGAGAGRCRRSRRAPACGPRRRRGGCLSW
jgi:uncharacterized protein (TIGR02996 family)